MKNTVKIPGLDNSVELDYSSMSGKVKLMENGVLLKQSKKQKGKPFELGNGELLFVKPSLLGIKGVYKSEKFNITEPLGPVDMIFGFLPIINFVLFMGAIPGIMAFLGILINISLLRSSLSKPVKYILCLVIAGAVFLSIFLLAIGIHALK